MSSIALSGSGCSSETTLTAANFADSNSPTEWSIRKTTLSDGLSTGVEVIAVDNGKMLVHILPTRGMGLWKIEHETLRLGWDSPVKQPVNPQFVNLQSRHGLGWLDGFNELLCRCGLAFLGPPGSDEDANSPIESEITLHGRIANTPADSVQATVTEDAIVISGTTREATLFGPNLLLETSYRIPFGSTVVELTDTVENRGSSPTEMQLLYHINAGSPLLEQGSRWDAPLKTVCARDERAAEGLDQLHDYLGPTAGYTEQAYLCQLIGDAQQQTTALLTNASRQAGFSLDFDLSTLPAMTVWKNTQPLADGYCTGLEPGTCYPNFKSVERKNGRVVQLVPGRWRTQLQLTLLANGEAVAAKQARIDQLRGGTSPEIHSSQAELTQGL